MTDEELGLLHARLAALFPVGTDRGALELHPLESIDPRGRAIGPLLIEPWGLWLGLQTHSGDRGTEGTIQLATAEAVGDSRLGPYAEGLILALASVLERAETLSSWAIGYFDVRMPLDALPPDAVAAQYRDYFLTYPWFGRLITRPAKPPPYVLAPPSCASVDRLWSWIYQHAQRTFVDKRFDTAMRKALPEPVRVMASLHTLHSMVGGNGFEVFLAQAAGDEIRDAYAALVAADAPKLRALMARGIARASTEGAEFSFERAKKWLHAFDDEEAVAWSEIDGHAPDRSYALLESELVPAAQHYADAHRAALVRAE